MIAENINTTLVKHKEQLDDLGITSEQVLNQLRIFKEGIPFANLIKPCRIKDGIIKIDSIKNDELISLYRSAAEDGRITSFVPASGAATRMFQKLLAVLHNAQEITKEELEEKAETSEEFKTVNSFIKNIQKFAFYDELISLISEKNQIESNNLDIKEVLEAVVFSPGLNYSSYPKGAIKFHKYSDEALTAFEEHIYEAASLAKDKSGKVKSHFTISDDHKDLFFNSTANTIQKFAKQKTNILIQYSFQKRHTNTIAVDLDDNLCLDSESNLIFRPGGHGALIENLNELNADLVLIKNIDNVLFNDGSNESNFYKKLMIGLTINLQKQVFQFLVYLERKKVTEKALSEIKKFASEQLSVYFPQEFDSLNLNEKSEFLFSKLNRPLRICGMVRNEGHPGGGPFWVHNQITKDISLQIIESSQVNHDDDSQRKIFNSSTHFNPVDIVCAVRNYEGNNFDLRKFVDKNSGLIAIKSHEGKNIKALELPGLWNGSMSDWNTVFVEIPLEAFNPVKEINDLLKPAHQPVA